MKRELADAETWEQTITVIARLTHNSVMSFMALWDIAYFNSVFPHFQSIPLFLSLAPRIRPQVQYSDDRVGGGLHLRHPKKSAKYREIIDIPSSLLFDSVSAILFYAKDRKFPDDPVPLGEIANLFGIAPKKLDRLRSGRDKLTLATLLGLLPKDDEAWVLVPLLYVAHTWNILLCPPRVGGIRNVMIPDDTYLRFWNSHRFALKAVVSLVVV